MQETFSSSNHRSFKDGVKAKRLSAGLERKIDVLVGLATAITLVRGRAARGGGRDDARRARSSS